MTGWEAVVVTLRRKDRRKFRAVLLCTPTQKSLKNLYSGQANGFRKMFAVYHAGSNQYVGGEVEKRNGS